MSNVYSFQERPLAKTLAEELAEKYSKMAESFWGVTRPDKGPWDTAVFSAMELAINEVLERAAQEAEASMEGIDERYGAEIAAARIRALKSK